MAGTRASTAKQQPKASQAQKTSQERKGKKGKKPVTAGESSAQPVSTKEKTKIIREGSERKRRSSTSAATSKSKRRKEIIEPKNDSSVQLEAPNRSYAAPAIIDSDADAELEQEHTKKKAATTKKPKQVAELEEIASSSSSDEEASSSESGTGSAGSEDVEDDDSEVEISTTKLQQRLELERPYVRGKEAPSDVKKGKDPHGFPSDRTGSVSDGQNPPLAIKLESDIESKPLLPLAATEDGLKHKHPELPTILDLPDSPGGKLSIKQQHPRLRACLHQAIDQTLKYLFFIQAFPLLPEKKRCYREALLTAARDNKDNDIEQELKSNKEYSNWLATVLDARVNNIKSQCKSIARNKVVEFYRLDTRSQVACKERVAYLQQRLPDYLFTFPEDPKSGKADTGKPFLHPMIIYILANAGGIKEAVQRLLPHFSETPNNEYEISRHLLALASVAAYNALDEYSTGTLIKRQFSADSVKAVYNDHLVSLELLACNPKNEATYHSLLRKIFGLAFSSAVSPTSTHRDVNTENNGHRPALDITINLD
ncbi:hypothetical protein QCA50_005533 [Cerrena zonata]|uniref:DUF6532 domain-containing protein n=1 Tax=Cerrena zonata TaxID=2478898 RepID=A0AAW0GAP4_9APHY